MSVELESAISKKIRILCKIDWFTGCFRLSWIVAIGVGLWISWIQEPLHVSIRFNDQEEEALKKEILGKYHWMDSWQLKDELDRYVSHHFLPSHDGIVADLKRAESGDRKGMLSVGYYNHKIIDGAIDRAIDNAGWSDYSNGYVVSNKSYGIRDLWKENGFSIIPGIKYRFWETAKLAIGCAFFVWVCVALILPPILGLFQMILMKGWKILRRNFRWVWKGFSGGAGR